MSSGQKVAIAAFVVLAVVVIGYFSTVGEDELSRVAPPAADGVVEEGAEEMDGGAEPAPGDPALTPPRRTGLDALLAGEDPDADAANERAGAAAAPSTGAGTRPSPNRPLQAPRVNLDVDTDLGVGSRPTPDESSPGFSGSGAEIVPPGGEPVIEPVEPLATRSGASPPPVEIAPDRATATPENTAPGTPGTASDTASGTASGSTAAGAGSSGPAEPDVIEIGSPPPPEPDAPLVEQQPDPLAGEAAVEVETYTVREGDSLWEIAARELGAGAKWELIAQANGLGDSPRIKPGDKLIIPTVAPERGPVAERTAEDPLGLGIRDGSRLITVGEGESLWTIARREYGDGTLWRRIYLANQDRLDSPDALRAGQEIILPPKPE
jgi:nucleoid-associated protein YgaU